MLRPDKSTCPWISLSRWPNPSIVTDQKFGMLHKTKVNKGRPTHLHVVRALEEQLVERIRLLAPDTDQTSTAERSILQANMIPLTDDTGRGRPRRRPHGDPVAPHRWLQTGAGGARGELDGDGDGDGGEEQGMRAGCGDGRDTLGSARALSESGRGKGVHTEESYGYAGLQVGPTSPRPQKMA